VLNLIANPRVTVRYLADSGPAHAEILAGGERKAITARVPHVFQSFAGILDEADEALDRAALFLRQRVRG
jgi:hypothetical protein